MENKNFIIAENNVKEYALKIENWINSQVKLAHADGVVLGMSGGVDCSVVARLCQEANISVYLLLMPYGNSMTNSKSYEDAMELINHFNFDYKVIDIKNTVDSIESTSNSIDIDDNIVKLANSNIRPRIRMTYLYNYAQLHNLLVIGTGNLSERTVGYFTKWGDGACDINPLANITKQEVYVLAKYLMVPDCIINKKPSAELWQGQNDEDDLGITYEQIDSYILKRNLWK